MFQSKLFTGNSISVIVDGSPYSVDDSHVNWDALKAAFKDNDSDLFVEKLNVKSNIESYVVDGKSVSTGLEVDHNGTVRYNGNPLHGAIVDLVLRNVEEGMDITPVSNFLNKLYNNISFNTREHLFNFLTHHRLTITEDGRFLAYKSVRSDFYDKYSGTILNNVGAVITFDRKTVDDNPNHHCSNGLHAGSLGYSGPGGWYNSPGDKIIIVAIDPEDVVSVPTDHDFQKLRCCKYTVVSEFKGELKRPVYSGSVSCDDCDSCDDYDDDELDEDYEDEEILATEMLCGSVYEFEYKGEEDFDYETRTVCVTDNSMPDRVICELAQPEDYAGETRCFLYKNILNGVVRVLDE